MKPEEVAWALVGLFNLLALAALGVGFAHLAGYTIVFSWQLILGMAVAVLAMTALLLALLIRQR